MKFLIALLCVFGCHSAFSMGLAIQQIPKAHPRTRSYDAQDDTGILTGLGMATVSALRSLSCPCYTSYKPKNVRNAKKEHGQANKSTKFE